jgi:ABC-type branched-subunit amino acid transport system substrate-binding protein
MSGEGLDPGRRILLGGGVGALALSLAGCGTGTLSGLLPGDERQSADPADAARVDTRLVLLLPLSVGGASEAIAVSMRNAAELALARANAPNVRLTVKDDRGTAEGAATVAREAISEGATIILGPVFSASVAAAGRVAREGGRPLIGFSTDPNAAGPGIYLLSFLADYEAQRVARHAVGQGIRGYAILAPDTAYGALATAAFARGLGDGGAIVVRERFTPGGDVDGPAQRLVTAIRRLGPRALFLPADATELPAIAAALGRAGFDPAAVRPLGTGVWNDVSVFGLREVQGGWFAAPDPGGYAAFAQNYRARFGTEPARLATLAYDAVSVAIALWRARGAGAYRESSLTDPAGFVSNADGLFRFRANGLNERGLAVLQIAAGSVRIASPAPRQFASR